MQIEKLKAEIQRLRAGLEKIKAGVQPEGPSGLIMSYSSEGLRSLAKQFLEEEIK